MKIYCNRNELNKALINVSHSVPARTTSPILEGILVEVSDNQLKLTATDTIITIETIISAECNEKGSFVVPAKLFSSIVAKLPEEDIMLDAGENKIAIKCGGSNTSLLCMSADEFPKIRSDEGNNEIMLSKESVKKLIKKTAFSASTDDFNGILTGVLLEIKDGNMKMVAADPFRIASYNVEVANDEDVSVIIPAKLASDVAKIISDEGEDNISLEVVDKKVVFKFDNNKVIINTFSGKYIGYERVLNMEGAINVRVQRTELLKSIDRASLLTSIQNNNLIKFNVENEYMIIKSLSEEGNIEEKVEIIKDGDDILIGLNSKYVKDVLSVIEDEEIFINFKDSTSPCIIKPLKGNKYKYVVLPIRIN